MSWHIWLASLFLTIKGSAAIVIHIDPITPIFGYPYTVKATIILHKISEASLFQSKMTFKMITKQKNCEVDNWKFCPVPPPTRPVWSCNCLNRYEKGMEAIYRFYFVVEKIDDSYQTEQVKVQVTGSQLYKTVQVEVIKFTKVPQEKEALRCCDQTKRELDWELVTQGNFHDRMAVQKIEWYKRSKQDVTSNTAGTRIAYATMDSQGNVNSSHTASVHYEVKGGGTSLAKLTIMCDEQIHEHSISIKVQFNMSKFLSKLNEHAKKWIEPTVLKGVPLTLNAVPLTKLLPHIPDDILSVLAQNNTPGSSGAGATGSGSGVPSVPPNAVPPNPVPPNPVTIAAPACTGNASICGSPGPAKAPTTTITTTTTTTTTTTKGPTTTSVPKLNYGFEDTQLRELVHEISLVRDVPPPAGNKLVIKVESTVSGDGKVLVVCEIVSSGARNNRGSITPDLGIPPINITIYKQVGKAPETYLQHKVGQSKIPFTTKNMKDLRFKCSLSGPAMDCIKKGDARCQNKTKDSTETNKKKTKFAEKVDPFLIMYALEMLVVVTLLMWTVGNLFEHIRLVMQRERMKQEQKLQAEMLKGHVSFGNRFGTKN